MKKTKLPYFENLDSLRFFAFFLVFARHYFGSGFYVPGYKAEGFLLNHFNLNGGLGVNLFFVLSGFLITYLLINEKQFNNSINLKNFYIRRILRIWPLYYLVIALCFFIVPLLTHKFSFDLVNEHFFQYAFFLNNFDILKTGFSGTENNNTFSILWSIAVEEQFYVVWPVLLLLIPGKYFPHLFAAVITCSLLFRFMHVENKFVIYFHTFSVISDFAVGAFLAYIAVYNVRFIAKLRLLKKNFILAVYFILALAILFHREWSNFNLFTRVFERLILAVFFVFVIAEQCYCVNSFFKLSRIKVAMDLGVISYGLYCLHLLNIAFVQKMNIRFGIDQKNGLVFYSEFFLTLALTILTSYLCYTYFEKIFLKLKHKFTVIEFA